jgi:hypothetical protein
MSASIKYESGGSESIIESREKKIIEEWLIVIYGLSLAQKIFLIE